MDATQQLGFQEAGPLNMRENGNDIKETVGPKIDDCINPFSEDKKGRGEVFDREEGDEDDEKIADEDEDQLGPEEEQEEEDGQKLEASKARIAEQAAEKARKAAAEEQQEQQHAAAAGSVSLPKAPPP